MISGRLSDGNVDTWRLELVGDDVIDIYANHRYFLTLNSDHSIGIVPVDYQTDPDYPTGNAVSGGNDTFESDFTTTFQYTGSASALGWTSADTYTFAAGAIDGDGFTFQVESQYGSKFEVECQIGNKTDIDNFSELVKVDKRAVLDRSTRALPEHQLSYKIVDTYTVQIPRTDETSSFSIKITLKVGKETRSIYFATAGTVSLDEIKDELGIEDDALATAIGDALAGLDAGATVEDITSIDLTGPDGPSSLAGLENLTNLTELNAAGNTNLEGAIDLSDWPLLETVDLSNNPNITEVDLSQNPELTSVNLEHTGISKIDLSNNPLISDLNVTYTSVSEIDLSNLSELEYGIIGYSLISSVDFTQNKKLVKAALNGNVNLTSVIFDNPLLSEIHLSECSALRAVDLSKLPALKRATIDNSAVEGTIDFSANSKIEYIQLNQCKKLTTVKLGEAPYLESIYLINVPLYSSINLPASGLPQLKNYVLRNNTLLTNIDYISKFPNLTNLDLNGVSGLTEIDITNNKLINTLNANNIPSLTIYVWQEFNASNPREQFTKWYSADNSNVTFQVR